MKEQSKGACLTCAANHYCPTHNPEPAGVATVAPALTEEEREHIHQAIDKLGDYEHLRPELRTETSRTRGVLQKLFRFLPARARGVPACDEREWFETWARQFKYELTRSDCNSDQPYVNECTDWSWLAWQERALGVALGDPADKLRRCTLGCFDYGQCKANMHGVPSECASRGVLASEKTQQENGNA